MRLRDNQRGAVMIFVAGSLFVFFGIAAVAVDLGLLQDERSDSQNAADLGALRAAWADCNGESDPVGAGIAIIAQNGYSAAEGDTVTITNSGGEWTATVATEIKSVFSGIFGISTLETTADAIAECQTASSGQYAIFAGASACDPTGTFNLSFPGSGNVFTGDVHTNQNLNISGDVTLNSNGTYVGTYSESGTVIWNPPPPGNPTDVGVAGTLSYPIDPTEIADYRPGGSEATAAAALGEYHDFSPNIIDKGRLETTIHPTLGVPYYDDTTKEILPGIYYTNTSGSIGIDLSMSDLVVAGGGGVTFVSEDQIKIAGDGVNIQPYDTQYGLLAFSNYIKTPIVPPDADKDNCTAFGIDLSGSNAVWEGILFAPRAQIKVPGSTNSTLNGSIIGLAVEMSGSGLTLTATGAAVPADPNIGLRE